MFEIGTSLREARERRNLSYGQVEAETAIRTRYIRALEDEDFHILPGPDVHQGLPARVRRVPRAWTGSRSWTSSTRATTTRGGSVEHAPIASQPRSRPPRRRHRRESNLVMIALAAIVAVSFLVVLALRFPPPADGAVQHEHEHVADDHARHDGERDAADAAAPTGTTPASRARSRSSCT